MKRLDGKTVVVSGGAGGIGSQVCLSALEEGATVVALDYSPDALQRLKGRVGDVGDRFVALAGDASEPDVAAELATRVSADAGPVDALVNVAGVFTVKDFVDTDQTDWAAALASNLFTAVNLCRVFAPGMIERGSGSIVNFASTAGEFGSIRPAAHYAAAKGAVIAFTKSLAREVSPLGVRVNAISPGPIDTAMFAADSSGPGSVGGTAQTGAARGLVGRTGSPLDIAYGVIYLASDESGYITGEVLRVNGGSLI